MAPNNLVALAAALREALAAPESLTAESKEEKEARLDLIDMMPEFNASLIGDANVLRELAWSVSGVSEELPEKRLTTTSGRQCSALTCNQSLGNCEFGSVGLRRNVRGAFREDWSLESGSAEVTASCYDE